MTKSISESLFDLGALPLVVTPAIKRSVDSIVKAVRGIPAGNEPPSSKVTLAEKSPDR